ncbi:MAG: hypothetical protein AB1736_03800 [Chloroflexota bacterium]
MARASFIAGAAAVALAAVAYGAGNEALAIVLGALALNVLIVASFFAARPYLPRLRRFLPPWLPW